MSIWTILLAVAAAAVTWVWWGWLTFDHLHDLGPGQFFRATFSPHFWRTGEIK